MLRKTNSKSLVNSGFLDIIERYWMVLLGLVLAVPVVLRYLKDSQVKNEVNDLEEQIKLNDAINLSPITQLSALNKITTNQTYHNWARSLAHNLGTLYQTKGFWSFLDPKGWTENDQNVYDLLVNVQNAGQKRTLSELYFTLTSKNLNEDVVRLLDDELLKKLPLFK